MTRPKTCSSGSRRTTSSSESACSSAPLIAPGPSPSVSPIAWAVTAWSPVIMRTSMPAPSAVCTAAFASARSGSMIPTMPTNDRSWVSDIGSSAIACELAVVDEPGGERQHPQTLLAHPLVRRVDARLGPRSIGTCEPLSGPPDSAAACQHHVGAALDQLDHALGAVHA